MSTETEMRQLRTLAVLLLVAFGVVPPMAVAQQPAAPVSTIPGEAIYPRPSREVWEHARTVLQKAGFRSQRQDNKTQLFVTQWRSYAKDLFPPLTLAPGDRPQRVQLHVMVATTHEPARVMVGSIVEVERRGERRMDTVFAYRVSEVERWFLDALDAQTGVKHEPMTSTFEARLEQARRLGNAAPCVPTAGGGVAAPVKLSNVEPLFPAQGFGSGEGKVLLNAVITEHGSMTNLSIVSPSSRYPHYEASARAAVSLWRFKPPTKDGCPIATFFTVTVTYSIR